MPDSPEGPKYSGAGACSRGVPQGRARARRPGPNGGGSVFERPAQPLRTRGGEGAPRGDGKEMEVASTAVSASRCGAEEYEENDDGNRQADELNGGPEIQ